MYEKPQSFSEKKMTARKRLYAEQTLVHAVYDPPALKQLIKAVRGKTLEIIAQFPRGSGVLNCCVGRLVFTLDGILD